MSYMANKWSEVQKVWLQEYKWLGSHGYPNEILKFIALYECLLAYSKASFWHFNDHIAGTIDEDLKTGLAKDHVWFRKGFESLIETKSITPDLNKNIFDLCLTLIRTCPQPRNRGEGVTYYDVIKKRVADTKPYLLSKFPDHEDNYLNNPLLTDSRAEQIYREHLPDLFCHSGSFDEGDLDNSGSFDEGDLDKRGYFKSYFSLLIHSRDWIYHNNKAGNTEPDKLVLKNHIKIMLFMLENWK